MRSHKRIRNTCALSLIIFVLSGFSLAGQPSGLVVIDPLVENEYKKISGDDAGQNVVILPGEGNPVKLIAEELKKSIYNEVHLYMLTKPGSIIFDELNIIPENVEEYSADFSEWKNRLKQGSEIIIHSEVLTSVPEGEFIIKKIADYTGYAVVVKK
jgi:hypothetical protein